jgi:hypothetical protein
VAINPNESADKKYYASKQPLNLRGTREGVKNKRPVFSSRQKVNDSTATSDKYYAAQDQSTLNETGKAPSIKKELTLRYKASDAVLQDVVAGFQEGGTLIEVAGNSDEIRKARAAIDMAVGRNTLTREQADVISFITISDTLLVELEPEPEKKVVKKRATRKKAAKKKTKKSEDVVSSILSDDADDQTKKEALKTGWEEQDDTPTEADVARAFGVTDDDDDDDSDD